MNWKKLGAILEDRCNELEAVSQFEPKGTDMWFAVFILRGIFSALAQTCQDMEEEPE